MTVKDANISKHLAAQREDRCMLEKGFGPDSDAKPTTLVLVDNGHGMDLEMIRFLLGSQEEQTRERPRFGRYGCGFRARA